MRPATGCRSARAAAARSKGTPETSIVVRTPSRLDTLKRPSSVLSMRASPQELLTSNAMPFGATSIAARAGLQTHAEALAIEVSPKGIAFDVKSSWGEARIESTLLGRFNVSNLLGVLTTMLVSGVPLERAAAALADLQPVAGRMQRLGGGGKPLVIVDYAHTPDALEKTLVALKDVARASGGRLVAVFGCGGERDRGKRPLMGAVASRHADAITVTSDNPRGEDPAAIIAEITAAIPVVHEAVEDRRTAIARAIASASADDVVLIAGKGHETYQEIAGRRLPFSDALEVQEALARWGR